MFPQHMPIQLALLPALALLLLLVAPSQVLSKDVPSKVVLRYSPDTTDYNVKLRLDSKTSVNNVTVITTKPAVTATLEEDGSITVTFATAAEARGTTIVLQVVLVDDKGRQRTRRMRVVISEVRRSPSPSSSPGGSPDDNPKGSPRPGGDDKPKTSPRPGGDDNPKGSPRPGGDDNPKDSPRPGGDDNPSGGEDKPKGSPRPGGDDKPKGSPRPGGDDKPKDSPRPGGEDKPKDSPKPDGKSGKDGKGGKDDTSDD